MPKNANYLELSVHLAKKINAEARRLRLEKVWKKIECLIEGSHDFFTKRQR
jgi:hypothetical protein